MRRLTPFALGLYLTGATVVVVLLQLIGGSPPPPHSPSSIGLLRLVIGLPVVLFAPALFVVPQVFRRDAMSIEGGRRTETLDLGWTLLAAMGLNIGFHVVHFNVLRVLGLPITWPALLAITAVECVAGLWWMRRSWGALRFAGPDRSTVRAFAVLIAVGVGFAVWAGPNLLRDGSWYFYHPAVEVGWEGTSDRTSVTLAWGDGGRFEDGSTKPATGLVTELSVANAGPSIQHLPVLFAVHTRVGANVVLRMGDRVLQSETIANLAPLEPGGVLVERYWEWGTAALVAPLQLRPGSDAILTVEVVPPEHMPQMGAEDVAFAVWSRLSVGEFLDDLAQSGHHHMHPFQLLNVTENIRWAHEVADDYVLAGRAADGSSSLHQPPAWTYLYAPAREMLEEQTVSAGALLLVILFGIGAAGLLGVRDEVGALPPTLGAVMGLGAVQHGRLMVSDGSMNFPDSLYAMALVVTVVALCSGRARVFVVWALLAALLRYPGAVVVALAGFTLLAIDPLKRRRILNALIRFGFGIAVICGLMLLVGVATRRLDIWFFALYFETIPEHFNNNPNALPFFERPIEFLKLWAAYGGAILLLAIPFRSKLSKVALGTALLYAPFLAFIDHFSHHYFLPLIGLAGVSACASLARIENPQTRRVLCWVAAVVAALLLAWT